MKDIHSAEFNPIVFATHNLNKLQEVREMMNPSIQIISLDEAGISDDIDETGWHFSENASIKSHFIHNRTGMNAMADDSGLSVDALNGAPGIYSARYSGSRDQEKNIDKLLSELKHSTSRKGQFVCALSLIINKKEYMFKGSIPGTILFERKGAFGFGYDAVFQPDGYDISFAEMKSNIKNNISHRALAMKDLNHFLENFNC